ncbi:hypothetical protein R69919_01984 [Paraburkholderia gardini]|nr:hypothetical protein R69919_01984 [Paraburkholderia gardini]
MGAAERWSASYKKRRLAAGEPAGTGEKKAGTQQTCEGVGPVPASGVHRQVIGTLV